MATTDIIVADDLKAALKSVADVRDQSLTLLDLVKTVHQESPNGPTLEQNTALTKADKLLRAHLAQLRGRNRKAILNTRATKQGTGVWRQEVDELHLSLQNLYYEQRHLRGEIAACKNYNHKYLELPMIDVEDFLAQHPERADDNADNLMIARIEDERVARQALEEERQALAAKKETLKERNAAQKAELDKLDGEIEKWLNGAGVINKVFEARLVRKAEVEDKERENATKEEKEQEEVKEKEKGQI